MKTDLKSVKMVAEALLLMPVGKTKLTPLVVTHPFTSSAMVAIRSGESFETLDILSSEEALEKWQGYIREEISEADTAFRIYMMFNKPYALTFLKYAQMFLSDEDFATILACAWTASENPHDDCNVSKSELLDMFRRAKGNLMMEEDEYKVYTELPETITVYRGVTDFNAHNYRGLAWSLDPAVAEWFADRFGEHGIVYRAKIAKQHVLAFFSRRNEAETVIDPQFLREVQKYQEIGKAQ